MTTFVLAQAGEWTPDAPVRLVTKDRDTSIGVLGGAAIAVAGGLVAVIILAIAGLRIREWMYERRAEAFAARRSAAAMRLGLGGAALIRSLAKASGEPAAGITVSASMLEAAAIKHAASDAPEAEKARVAELCRRYGVKVHAQPPQPEVKPAPKRATQGPAKRTTRA